MEINLTMFGNLYFQMDWTPRTTMFLSSTDGEKSFGRVTMKMLDGTERMAQMDYRSKMGYTFITFALDTKTVRKRKT
jgi:hypothetical protein